MLRLSVPVGRKHTSLSLKQNPNTVRPDLVGKRTRLQAGSFLRWGQDENTRGAEQWIKEGKNAVKWTRLSCHDFADNQVRLQLFALAYNLGNFLRRLALPRSVKHWSLIPARAS